MKRTKAAEAKAPLTIDGETQRPDPSPLGASEIPLSSAVDVRREQAKVYREARGGTLDKQDAAKLIWMLDCIRKSIETEEFEKRIAELEERTSNGQSSLPALTARAH